MDETITLDELLIHEKDFLLHAMPAHSHPSEDVIGTDCCAKKCVFYLKRLDVLTARFHYMKFFKSLDGVGNHQFRQMFISSLIRFSGDRIMFTPINLEVDSCATVIARVFGMSVHVLLNRPLSTSTINYSSRPWYRKTVSALGDSLNCLSKIVQFNSLNRIMLPPNFSSRLPLSDSHSIHIGMIKRKMDLPIQKRKTDTLTRCIACCTLPELMIQLDSEEKRKEAGKMLRLHHLAVSQQRVIVDCLTRQSRDPDSDITTLLMDAMSNRCTKLPMLINRPKSISDTDRLAMMLSTVQLSEQHGENKFRNMEFPVLQGIFHHDSNYNLSILFDGISRLRSVGSTLFVVMDSSRNNKSFAFFGGIGFLLTRTKHVRQVTLIYPSVGHTHLSVDGHFGVVSKSISRTNIKDPEEFVTFLNSLPSVAHVNSFPTVYDFSQITEFMYRSKGLCSNGIINIFRNDEGKISYSSSLTMNSTQLVGADIGQVSNKLFKDEYYSSSYHPTIKKPDNSEIQSKLQNLMKHSSIILSKENEKNFKDFMSNYGKKAFDKLIMEINDIPSKVPALINSDQDPQMTVLRFLEKNGVNAGRTPQQPTIHTSQMDP